MFLVNPAAANGSTGRRWPEIAHQAAGVGLEGDALLSERRGHLGELAREAALDGARLLVVVGGDGSINEVVNGLAGIESPPAVALIPRGTGGDFVRTFDIPNDIAAAARVALTGDTRSIDLGRVGYRSWDGSDGSALFANVASAGMSGAIAQRANDTSKALGAQGLLPLGHVRRVRRVVCGGDAADGRRRVPRRAGCSTSSSRTGATSAAE